MKALHVFPALFTILLTTGCNHAIVGVKFGCHSESLYSKAVGVPIVSADRIGLQVLCVTIRQDTIRVSAPHLSVWVSSDVGRWPLLQTFVQKNGSGHGYVLWVNSRSEQRHWWARLCLEDVDYKNITPDSIK